MACRDLNGKRTAKSLYVCADGELGPTHSVTQVVAVVCSQHGKLVTVDGFLGWSCLYRASPQRTVLKG